MNFHEQKKKNHSSADKADKKTFQAVWKGGGNMGGAPLGPKEIDGLLVLPSKVSMLLTDHPNTG